MPPADASVAEIAAFCVLAFPQETTKKPSKLKLSKKLSAAATGAPAAATGAPAAATGAPAAPCMPMAPYIASAAGVPMPPVSMATSMAMPIQAGMMPVALPTALPTTMPTTMPTGVHMAVPMPMPTAVSMAMPTAVPMPMPNHAMPMAAGVAVAVPAHPSGPGVVTSVVAVAPPAAGLPTGHAAEGGGAHVEEID